MVNFRDKLEQLPNTAGVYFFLGKNKKIIYIGKAANLKNRVSSYFQKQSSRDIKLSKLIPKIKDIRHIEAESELQALFLESEFIKRYKPIFNVREKDDKNFVYLKISNADFPIVSYERRVDDDGSKYFGPFVSSQNLRRAMRYLRKIFPYITSKKWPNVSALEYQIGLVPSPDIDKKLYKKNIRNLIMIIEGKTNKLLKDLEKDMKNSAKNKEFEKAARLRDQISNIKFLQKEIIFSDRENFDITLDIALNGMTNVFGLNKVPSRIEAYDISNFSGHQAVASMIVFKDGLPDAKQYRRFKMHSKGPNDFAMMQEVIERRFSKHLDWPLPDLIIIDGGKAQLSSALKATKKLNINVFIAGITKKFEQIVIKRQDKFQIINLDRRSASLKLIQRIRDEAHRFAVTYHRNLKKRETISSKLKDIPGIGDKTYQKLIKEFGSAKEISKTSQQKLAKKIGKSKAALIKKSLLSP